MRVVVSAVAAVVLVVVSTNALVILTTRNNIHQPWEVTQFQADAILVLGASVHPDGTPSQILADRVDGAVQLYFAGVAPKLIMSGDNSEASYNECRVMKDYAISKGVPSEDIFCDHAGFSTYESVYRARYVFGCTRLAISTQTYHLYRALYAAEGLDMVAVGVPTDYRVYTMQTWYDVREIAARTKDVLKTFLKLESTFVGDPISLNQSGDVTD